ncbi:ABC transporter permease [Alkalihalobacillus pseudalcaliphilus]|uniref:ABC transporter permease n=1 Tax=Alkalihalobacillus pseudalcaliphilus TaxID=79884 RepID=UPI00064DFB9F|nr:sugar ABC transporter permease [Alkalihalobacillus pseudalcaliphilus]KMK78072.1 protein lplB [Alkalihalobacillus pseudalcaliphilus]
MAEPSVLDANKPHNALPKKVTPKKKNVLIKHWDLYLIMVPGILFFLIYRYVPMWGVVIAFQDYSVFAGISGSEWVGWKHFERMFETEEFYRIFSNTLLISLYKLFWGFPAPIIVALMLNELRNMLYKRTIQTVIYMPHFLSWVIVGGIMINILEPSTGIINQFISFLGFEPIYFIADDSWFRTVLVTSDLWKSVGWGTILYLAALAGINPQLYEAARVDGANKWQQTWHITLPSLLPTIVILFILQMGNILEVGFEQVFILLNPLVYNVGDVFETYVYRVGITQGQFSYTTAVGLFKSVIALILVVGANKIAKKLGQNGLW